MGRAHAGDTVRPQDIVLPLAAVSGGFATYLTIINLAGEAYARSGIALGAFFFFAVCIAAWSVASFISDRDERRYALIVLASQLCNAADGVGRAAVLNQIKALSSLTDQEAVLLMADGQLERTARPSREADAEAIGSLTRQIRDDQEQILDHATFTREIQSGLSTLAEWLGTQPSKQAVPGKAESPKIIAYVVAELRRLAELGQAA